MSEIRSEKPQAVRLAMGLLWTALALGIVRVILDWEALSAAPNFKLIVISLGIVLGLYAFLYAMISSGRNWARIALLVLVVVDVVLSAPNVASEFSRAGMVAALGVVSTVAQAAALFMLFTSPGKSWFGKKAAG